jgi:hypothetical protein
LRCRTGANTGRVGREHAPDRPGPSPATPFIVRATAAPPQLFRSRPSLIPTLLPRLGVRVPPFSAIELTESTFPVPVQDFHTDLAVLLRGAQDELLLVALVEVQLEVDPDKPYRWLLYQAAAQDRHRCDVLVLVVAPMAHVARWARRARPLGPRGSYAPLVLGPEHIPKLGTQLPEGASPELAVLSLLAHARRANRSSFRAANEALAMLDPDQASLYLDLLYRTMGAALFRALEESMIVSKPYSGLFEKYYREGEAKGKAEGIAEGKAEGIAEGKAEGLAEALMRVLTARSLTPSPQQRSTILACPDPRRVERWIERALRATSVEEALQEE